jgi:transposase
LFLPEVYTLHACLIIANYILSLPRFDGHPEKVVNLFREAVMGGKIGHRQFSREFKRNALQLVEKGVSVGKVARDLDIHPNLIHRWRRDYLAEGESAFVGSGKVKPEEAEVKRLQRELEEVKEERDILKKALGVFSKRSW